MKEITCIEIIVNSLNKNIKLIINPNSLLVNNNKKISKELLDKLFKTICLWKHEYGYNNTIDSEEFTINVKTSNRMNTYHGKGIYPNNYQEFLRIIGNIYE